MLQNGVQFDGDSFPSTKISIVNKTGAALVVGGVYALDLFQADADTNTVQKSLAHVVAVSAANIDGILVVAIKALADDESGLAVVMGPVKALVDGSGTAVTKADRLKATAASINLTKATEAVGSVDIAVAKALETYAGAAALKTVFFMGLQLNTVINAAVS